MESVELPEIVMRTQQSPATIRALYEEYGRPLSRRPEGPVDLIEYQRSSRALDERIAAMQGQPQLMRANGGVMMESALAVCSGAGLKAAMATGNTATGGSCAPSGGLPMGTVARPARWNDP